MQSTQSTQSSPYINSDLAEFIAPVGDRRKNPQTPRQSR
uniref:Uncharacterized protein n=1 Tax=Serratia marcescens TaxID=615 RepID=A0A345ING5_SERMA|nr:hypothetical protein [Serratia marcescens]